MGKLVRSVAAIAACALLGGCAANQQPLNQQAPTPTTVATPQPTATGLMSVPNATAVPRLPSDVRVAGVDVSALTNDQARQRISSALAPAFAPLSLEAGSQQAVVRPDAIDLTLALDPMLSAAWSEGSGARVALQLDYDRSKLLAQVEELAKACAEPAQFQVLTDTAGFAAAPGARIDVDAAMSVIESRLKTPGSPRRVTLPLEPEEQSMRPAPALLQHQLETLLSAWKGVAGAYVYDIAEQQPVAAVNDGTVFTAASTMKAAILLFTYTRLTAFTPAVEGWLQRMIVESNNLAANQLLAAAAGGTKPADAARGAQQMSQMLRDLGLKNTYMLAPYMTPGFETAYRAGPIKPGGAKDGSAPYTVSSRYLRTTPSEMAQVFRWMEECRTGGGPLLEQFAATLTPARCQEMLDRLEGPADHTRLMAGLPAGTRASHKGGWIDDVNADVGIVRSPGGDYLISVYVYRPAGQFNTSQASAIIAATSRLVYSYYNPTPLAISTPGSEPAASVATLVVPTAAPLVMTPARRME